MIEDKLKYKRTVIIQSIKIPSGQVLSEILDCGGMQPRALLIPSNWTTSDINFTVHSKYVDQDYPLMNFDGATLAPYRIPNVTGANYIPVLPFLFDSIPYMIVSRTVSAVTDLIIGVVLQPIYQGIHG